MSNRLEVLKNMLAQNPNDSFARYGLAMEYANSGDLENAIGEYRALLALHPDYSAAYYHGGQAWRSWAAATTPARSTGRGSRRLRASAICMRAANCRRRWIHWGDLPPPLSSGFVWENFYMQEDASKGPAELKIKIVDIEDDQVKNFQVPSFVNYANVFHVGTDVYLDMGLVTAEQLALLKAGMDATVAIYDRFAMNPSVFDEMVERMVLLRDQLKAKGLIRNAAADQPDAR